jgi:hypothetical protein
LIVSKSVCIPKAIPTIDREFLSLSMSICGWTNCSTVGLTLLVRMSPSSYATGSRPLVTVFRGTRTSADFTQRRFIDNGIVNSASCRAR